MSNYDFMNTEELIHGWNTSSNAAEYRNELRRRCAAAGIDPRTPMFVQWLLGSITRRVLEEEIQEASRQVDERRRPIRDIRRVLEDITTAPTVRAAFEALKNCDCTLHDPLGIVTMPPEEMWRFVNEVINGVARAYARYSPGQQNLINMIIDVYSREFAAQRREEAA